MCLKIPVWDTASLVLIFWRRTYRPPCQNHHSLCGRLCLPPPQTDHTHDLTGKTWLPSEHSFSAPSPSWHCSHQIIICNVGILLLTLSPVIVCDVFGSLAQTLSRYFIITAGTMSCLHKGQSWGLGHNYTFELYVWKAWKGRGLKLQRSCDSAPIPLRGQFLTLISRSRGSMWTTSQV